jgi:hydroxymethylglutaryl-CoA lyase
VTGETPDVTIYEVGPRDGLQNEPRVISSEAKLELVGRLGRAGLRRVEVTSFVSPRWIPQLADADAVAAAVPKLPGVVYSALVPNPRGYERLRKAETVAVAAVFLSASETHNRRNLNCSIAEQLERLGRVAERARSDQVPLRAYVSTVCGCPYEGAVAPSAVVQLVRTLFELGVSEVSLGDTIGVGHPSQIRALVRAVAGEAPLERVALHLHDTYGRALAASGNVATEDVVDLFAAEGVATGIELESLVDTAAWLEGAVLDHPLPGRVTRARLAARRRSSDGEGEA